MNIPDRLLLEMVASPLERGLLNALWKNPYDQAAMNAYRDFLTEQGREQMLRELDARMLPGFGKLHDWVELGGQQVCKVCTIPRTHNAIPTTSSCYGPAISSGMIASGMITMARYPTYSSGGSMFFLGQP